MSFSVDAAKSKLKNLSGSQQSVETLSMWFRHYNKFAKQCVRAWKEELEAAEPKRKLYFLFLANDVLQQNRDFAKEFMSVLQWALEHCHKVIPENKRPSIVHMLDVWSERKLFSHSFIASVRNSLQPTMQKQRNSMGESLNSLQSAFMDAKHSSTQDGAISRQVDALSTDSSLFDLDGLREIRNRKVGGELAERIDDACRLFATHQGRLAAAFEDRNTVLRLLAAVLEQNQQRCRQIQLQQLECDNKQAAVQAQATKLSDRTVYLPKSSKESQPAAKPPRLSPTPGSVEPADMEVVHDESSAPILVHKRFGNSGPPGLTHSQNLPRVFNGPPGVGGPPGIGRSNSLRRAGEPYNRDQNPRGRRNRPWELAAKQQQH